MSDTRERELKLVPGSEALLDVLADIDRLGSLTAHGRHRELQRNSFFDSPSGSLRKARVGFRRRGIEGQTLATWSIKGGSENVRGVSSRDEIEARLDPDMAP